jgi:hypothetical protein
MKVMKILALAVGFVFLGRDPAAAAQQEVTYRHETTLSFKTCLFEANIKTDHLPEKGGRPNILLLARLFGTGLMSAKPTEQLDNLKTYFRLPDLAAKKESGDVTIAWRVYEEGKNGREETQTNQKISQVVELGGDKYGIFIIPQQINVKDNFYQFLIEIRRNKRKEAADADLVSSELLVNKELLWNFHGPIAIGFFFPDKVYFLTLTIWAGWSSSGGRIAAAMEWII